MAGNETVFQQPIKYGLFEVNHSLSFPTAGQGNADPGNENGNSGHKEMPYYDCA